MELDYTWARVKFLHWLVERSSNTGNIFVQPVAQHCCIASWKALFLLFPPSLPTCHAANFNVASCGNILSCKVGLSSTFQQTFNFMICVTTCYASQHFWLVTFPAPKVPERWWVSARLTSAKFWAGSKWRVRTSAICGLWKFHRSSAFLANYMRKIMWLLINIHTVIEMQ